MTKKIPVWRDPQVYGPQTKIERETAKEQAELRRQADKVSRQMDKR